MPHMTPWFIVGFIDSVGWSAELIYYLLGGCFFLGLWVWKIAETWRMGLALQAIARSRDGFEFRSPSKDRVEMVGEDQGRRVSVWTDQQLEERYEKKERDRFSRAAIQLNDALPEGLTIHPALSPLRDFEYDGPDGIKLGRLELDALVDVRGDDEERVKSMLTDDAVEAMLFELDELGDDFHIDSNQLELTELGAWPTRDAIETRIEALHALADRLHDVQK